MNEHSTAAPIRAVPAYGLFSAFVLAVLALRPLIASEDATARDGLLDAGAILGLGFSAAACLWLLARRGASRLPTSRLAQTSGALAVVAILSAASSCCPLLTLSGSSRLVSFALLLVVLERLTARNPQFARTALAVALATSVPSLLVAAWQYFGAHTAAPSDAVRVTGLFSHPNLLATHLALLLVVSVALLPMADRRVRIVLLLYMGAAGGTLFLTLSRTAWLALLCGVLVIGMIQYRWLFPVVGVALPVLLLVVPGVAERFSDIDVGFVFSGIPQTAGQEFDPGNTFEWRVSYWSQVLPLVTGHELTGLGFETVAERRPEDYPPHNEFVRSYVEMGAFGLVTFLAVLVACARDVVAGLRSARPGPERAYAVAFAGCAVTFAVRLAVENPLGDVPNLWLFAVVAAPVLARLVAPARPISGPAPVGGRLRAGAVLATGPGPRQTPPGRRPPGPRTR